MSLIVAIALALLDPHTAELATGVQRLAPTISRVDAEAHAFAASAAARAYGVDAALVLAIAHHESRFEVDAVGPEAGGKVSCGVMTPVPKASCAREGMLASYLTGTAHLRGWIDAAHGDMHTALIGYAGGYHLIAFCAKGGQHRGCQVAEVFVGRAAIVRGRLHS